MGVADAFSNVSSNFVFLISTLDYSEPNQIRFILTKNETDFGEVEGQSENEEQTG